MKRGMPRSLPRRRSSAEPAAAATVPWSCDPFSEPCSPSPCCSPAAATSAGAATRRTTRPPTRSAEPPGGRRPTVRSSSPRSRWSPSRPSAATVATEATVLDSEAARGRVRRAVRGRADGRARSSAEVATRRRTRRPDAASARSSRSAATAPDEIFVRADTDSRASTDHRRQGAPTTKQCLVPVDEPSPLVVGRRPRPVVAGSAGRGRRYFTPMRVGDGSRCDAVGRGVEHRQARRCGPRADHRRGAAAVEVEGVLGAELLASARASSTSV